METWLSAENVGRLNPNEEVFCSTLTFHPLLENPTGDTVDDLQDNIILGFVGIFSHARDEGKISCKLVECINTYLLEDRPNLGGKSLEIHQAVNHFVFRILLFAMGSCKNLLGLSLLMFFTAPGVKSSPKSAFPLNEFIDDIHNKIAAAAHHWHKANHLA